MSRERVPVRRPDRIGTHGARVELHPALERLAAANTDAHEATDGDCGVVHVAADALRRGRLTQGSEAGIHWLALHREDTEDTFMYSVERLATYEPLECFGSEREFADREPSLSAEAAAA